MAPLDRSSGSKLVSPVASGFDVPARPQNAIHVPQGRDAYTVSGTIKNALDWLVSFESFAAKFVAVLNTSPRAYRALSTKALCYENLIHNNSDRALIPNKHLAISACRGEVERRLPYPFPELLTDIGRAGSAHLGIPMHQRPSPSSYTSTSAPGVLSVSTIR